MTRRHSRLTGLRRSLALVLGVAAVLGPTVPARAASTYTTNLYVAKAFLYQDPYGNACTAASAMIMLNTIAYRKTGGPDFGWTPYRVKNNTANLSDKRDMTSVLWFARAHDTLTALGSGSDAHGWRNALNYYGWGLPAMTDAAQNVYRDLEFTTFDAAVHAAVRAIARYGMPVGIVGWAGRHAQVMTGFVVEGEDPATSDAFTVRFVYITDPLMSDRLINTKVAYSTFQTGVTRVRFQRYREVDSPYDDPYVAGWRRSSVRPSTGTSEWYGRFVIIAPVRGWLPVVDPPPNPDPSPSPSPTPPPEPPPTPDPTPSAAPASEPAASASAASASAASASAAADASASAQP